MAGWSAVPGTHNVAPDEERAVAEALSGHGFALVAARSDRIEDG